MRVTDVRLRKMLTEGKMKAIVSVTIDDAFVIHDVKVVDGQNGLFVAMPSRKMNDGTFRDIAHPISQDARDLIQKSVMDVYYSLLEITISPAQNEEYAETPVKEYDKEYDLEVVWHI